MEESKKILIKQYYGTKFVYNVLLITHQPSEISVQTSKSKDNMTKP